MGKLNKKDYINIIILLAVNFLFIIIFTRFKYIFGSTTDWQNQHWAFPEYFRNLFYQNHDLTPNLALNIGGGQNIYNFSYYGLYSPIIMLSYLFPFVSMMNYIIITSIIAVAFSIFLFYLWLKRNGNTSTKCFFVSFIFLCSSPLIFFSHRHVMFINYLPFMLLAFIGIDRYFLRKKTTLLLISTFLMIMTSYFFSVSAIVVFFVYTIYKYLKLTQKFQTKELIKNLLHIALPVIISVLMSAILLLPTFSAILNGRNGISGGDTENKLTYFIPQIILQNILYNPYSLGLTAVAIFALISGFFSKRKENIFLSTVFSAVLLFPIFIYILNGTLYLDSKVLIPFIPLICILIGDCIGELFKNRKFNLKVFILFFTVSLIGILSSQQNYRFVFLADAIIAATAIFFFCKTGKKLILYSSLIVFPVICCIASNSFDTLLSYDDYNSFFSKDTDKLITDTINEDKSLYRFSNELFPLSTVNKIYSMNYYQTTVYSSIYNKPYNNFYYNVFNNEINFRNSVLTNATKNVLFDMFMGNKYVITDSGAPAGYSLVRSNDKAAVFKNDNVLPFGYSTDKIMSNKDFSELKYPYSDEALLKYGVVNADSTRKFSTNIEPFKLDIDSIDYENVDYKKENGTIFVNAEDNAKMSLKLKQPINNKILIIRFNMNIRSKYDDTYIFINGVKNKLTCTDWRYRNNNYIFDYVISSNEPIEKLDLKFMKGKYGIDSIETYLLDYDKIKNINNSVDPFEPDMTITKGDVIAGKIKVSNDGYFILNVPYDQGFAVNVDGKSVTPEKVNQSFIGFKISKGEHKVEITYQAPLQHISLFITLFGLISAVIYILLQNKSILKKKK